ncbi:MFS transporter [Streptacidiphilus sp. 4-A2]|nr:MFS transporter [Streptacidiphilus sp. 4-A2]
MTGGGRQRPGSRERHGAWRTRVSVLKERDFRRFCAGYVTSLFGTSMATPAVAFAVLDGGGDAVGLGWVMAAGIAPQIVFMLLGGVAADRFGRRRVMLAADAIRCAAQAAFAAVLFLDNRPHIWVFVLLAAVRGRARGSSSRR